MNNKEPLQLWLPELNSLQINKVREFLRAEYERGFKDGQSAGVLDGEIKQDAAFAEGYTRAQEPIIEGLPE